MKLYLRIYILFSVFVFFTSCKESNQIKQQKENILVEKRDAVTPDGPKGMVRNVRQDKNGNILIASFQDVFRYNGKSFTNLTNNIKSPSFWDVLEDRKGNLWFATKDSGVYFYNKKTIQHFTTQNGLPSNFVASIYEDKAGNVWLATGGGASRYDGKKFRNFTTKDGLSSNAVTSIMEDKTGKLWFGTRDEPCYYDGKKFTAFKKINGKTFYNVWSIIEDQKGNIWFGGSILKDRKGEKGDTLVLEFGLWRYDGKTYTKVSNRGTSIILEDKKGNIWTTGAVKPNGYWVLSRYDQKTLYDKNPKVTEIFTLKGMGMLCGILEAKDGSIWFGSLAGVYRYDGMTLKEF
ncbi:histidine kinase [Flavobacterium sp. 17A]|uniref:Histidine kinase n=1 Tax=Flavobacterium potami TaxID=2872310 RepID=A0A9X1HA19_9FLAO|nr:two-component regulator propeller domain-containing protein [Flavobacterium potami]MBZ4035504.1 histidine kinase [Flavobacterium potami]